MKTKAVFLLAAITAFGTLSLPAESPAAWRKLASFSPEFTFNYAGFADASKGVTVGYAGEVHYTADGGKTWAASGNSGWCLFGLDFAGEADVYASGNSATFMRSADRGETWAGFGSFGDMEPQHPRYLYFADAGTFAIATDRTLSYSLDGGESYVEPELPGPVADGSGPEIAQAAVLPGGMLYILGSDGILYSTKDAGATWAAADLGQGEIVPSVPYQPCAAIRFTAGGRAGTIAYYNLGDERWYVLESADFGRTWKRTASIAAERGSAYLSPDARRLTLSAPNGFIELYSR